MAKPPATDLEAEYFERAMADAVRLAPDPHERVRISSPVASPRVSRPARSTSTPPGAPGAEAADSESGFVVDGVDRRELRKLKRGDYAPGDRLDLHGLMAAEAVVQVTRFVDTARSRHRCVCIVHGRGLHSAGNVAILKARVRAALREHRAVLAYADAPRGDGGSGAVYVLLRR